jgi:hypothetical protein
LTGQKVKKLLCVLKCKTRFFTLNLVLKCARLPKFACDVPNQIAPNHIALNRTMQSRTKACITKSCLNERVNIAGMKWNDTVFFFGTLSIIKFFKEIWRFRSQLWFHFQVKKRLTWWIP